VNWIKKTLIIIICASILPLLSSNIVYASIGLQSSFLKNSLTALKIISSNQYGVKVDSSNKYKGFDYKFFTGVSMLDIRTYNRKETDILDDFRSKFNINEKVPYIINSDVEFLDNVLHEQETLDLQRLDFYKGKYPWITIDSDNTELSLHYKSSIYMLISYLPIEHVKLLRNVKIHYNSSGVNGYGGNGDIIIRGGYLIDTNKFIKVFTHEMGHVVDTGMIGDYSAGVSNFVDMSTTLYNNDPNIGFFNISWNNDAQKKSNMNLSDFVSKYAYDNNSFEDFAESYVTYVMNGNRFRCMSYNSSVIEAKYQYMKKVFFHDREYFTGDSRCFNEVVNDATD